MHFFHAQMHTALESYLFFFFFPPSSPSSIQKIRDKISGVISTDAWDFQSKKLNDKKQVACIWSVAAVYG